MSNKWEGVMERAWSRMRTRPGSLVATLCVVLFPLFLLDEPYYLDFAIFAGIYYMVAVGLALVFGLAGQLSLAHGAFFGIGAYTSAIASTEAEVPVLVGLVGGVLLSGTVAWGLARPIFRLRGFYLAMATLAFGEIAVNVFEQEVWLTNGSAGIVGLPFPALGDFVFDSPLRYYYLVAAVAGLCLWISINVSKSDVGRGLRAIAGSETGATASGINVAKYKTWVFVISAAFAAAAGSLYVHYTALVNPGNFSVDFAVLIVMVLAVGGLDSVVGAFFGAAILVVVPNLLADYPRYSQLLFAVIFLAFVAFLPKGVAGLFQQGWFRLGAKLRGTRAAK